MDLKERKLGKYYKLVEKDYGISIKSMCSRCGAEIEVGYYPGNIEDESSLENLLKQNNMNCYSDDAKPYCSECRVLNSWEVVLNVYLNAYSNDKHMVSAIKDIYRYVSCVHTGINSAKFEQMLKDRFITSTQNEINVWNLAVDECKMLSKSNCFEYAVPSKWRENKVANGIFGFLGL